MRKQLPLLAISAMLAFVMLAGGVHQWWAWTVWLVVVASQIAVGLGLPDRMMDPKPPHPARHLRPDYTERLEGFELDRQHQLQVDEWRARQQDHR